MSKKVHNEVTNGAGLFFEDKNGRIVSATYTEPDYNQQQSWILTYHSGRMPAHSGETFDSESALVTAMRKIGNLVSWKRRES